MRDTFVRKERPLADVRRNQLTDTSRYQEYNSRYNEVFGKAARNEITAEEYRREVKALDAEYADVITLAY